MCMRHRIGFNIQSQERPTKSLCRLDNVSLCLCSTVSLVHHVYFTVSLFYRVYVPPYLSSLVFMFYRLFSPPCLRYRVLNLSFLCSTVSLALGVYVSRVFSPWCLCSAVSLVHRVYVIMSLVHHVYVTVPYVHHVYVTVSLVYRVYVLPCL